MPSIFEMGNLSTDTHTQGEAMWRQRQNWSDVATSQGMLRIDHHHQRLGERHGQLLPESPQKEPTLPASWLGTSSLQKCESKKNRKEKCFLVLGPSDKPKQPFSRASQISPVYKQQDGWTDTRESATCPGITCSGHPICVWYKCAVWHQWTSLRWLHLAFIHSQCEKQLTQCIQWIL